MADITIIESGYILVDGGAMFGAVPKRAWQRNYPCNEDNLCRLAMRCLLVVSANRCILIDTGMGDKQLAKLAYYQPHRLMPIIDSLEALGYTAADITDVILTHLHFDHCGGATYLNEEGALVPSFPNAHYWLGTKQWESFLQPNRLEADAFLKENILPIYEAGLLHFVDADMQLCEEVSLQLYDGHSAGQLVTLIDTNEGISAFVGDLIPTMSHVSLEWISAYDVCAAKAVSEKERFLAEAYARDYTLIYCHDENIATSRVKRVNDNYKGVK